MHVIEAHATFKTNDQNNYTSGVIEEVRILEEGAVFPAGFSFVYNEKGVIPELTCFIKDTKSKESEVRRCFLIYSTVDINNKSNKKSRNKKHLKYILKEITSKRVKRGVLLINKRMYQLVSGRVNQGFDSLIISGSDLFYEISNTQCSDMEDSDIGDSKENIKKENKNIEKVSESKHFNKYEEVVEKYLKTSNNNRTLSFWIHSSRNGPIYILFIRNIIRNKASVIIRKCGNFTAHTLLLYFNMINQEGCHSLLDSLCDIPVINSNIPSIKLIERDFDCKITKYLDFQISRSILLELIKCVLLEYKLIIISESKSRGYDFAQFLFNCVSPFKYYFHASHLILINKSSSTDPVDLEMPFPFIFIIDINRNDLDRNITGCVVFDLDTQDIKLNNSRVSEIDLPNKKVLRKDMKKRGARHALLDYMKYLLEFVDQYICTNNNRTDLCLESLSIKNNRKDHKKDRNRKEQSIMNTFIGEFAKTRSFLKYADSLSSLNKIKEYPMKYHLNINNNKIDISPYFIHTNKLEYTPDIDKLVLLAFPDISMKYFNRLIKTECSYLIEILPFILYYIDPDTDDFKHILNKVSELDSSLDINISNNKNSSRDIDLNIEIEKIKDKNIRIESAIPGIERILVRNTDSIIIHSFEIIDPSYLLYLVSDRSVLKYLIKYEKVWWNIVAYLCFFVTFNKVDYSDVLPSFCYN